MKARKTTSAPKVGSSAIVRRSSDWTAKDRQNWSRIIAMRAQGWSMQQMTTGTRLKRFTINRLLKEYRAAHTPNAEVRHGAKDADLD